MVRVVEVELRRLDSVLDSLTMDIPQPNIYLKIDTQGYDLNVLDGATRVLDRVLAFQAEVSVKPVYEATPNYLEAIAAMSDLGYELTGLFPVARDNALRVVEFDCVMVRGSAAGESTNLHPP